MLALRRNWVNGYRKAILDAWRSSMDRPSEEVALLVAIGFVLGVFPVPWCPTLLCAVVAFTLRLSFPALEVVNQITTPVQFALMVPYARMGARLLGPDPPLGALIVPAIVGWLCLSVPLGMLIYGAMLLLLRRPASSN